MLFNELFENHVVFIVRDTFIITLVQSSKHNNSDIKIFVLFVLTTKNVNFTNILLLVKMKLHSRDGPNVRL